MITFVEDNSHLGHTEKKDNNIMVLIKRYVEKQNASREPRKENLFDYTLQLQLFIFACKCKRNCKFQSKTKKHSYVLSSAGCNENHNKKKG